ncbi:hypothetical protein HAX54_022825, partial [Datura stramonium]|nr:hypothetical protein [Datura stramonium]
GIMNLTHYRKNAVVSSIDNDYDRVLMERFVVGAEPSTSTIGGALSFGTPPLKRQKLDYPLPTDNGWLWLFTDASQVGTNYSPVLRRVAPAINLGFTGWHRLFTGGSQFGIGCSQFEGQVTQFH